MTEFETLYFDIEGVKTALNVAGEGEPVLFLHGASTLEGFDLFGRLGSKFQMLMPAHPGMGLSGDAPHISCMGDLVLHYLNLLDALELPCRPHLIGFSMGGWLATELAAVARERFGRIVLVAPAGLQDADHPFRDLATIPPQEFPSYLAHDAAVALQYFPDGSDPDAAARFSAARLREAELVSRLCQPFGMGHPNLAICMRRITNPTLLIWGAEDRILPCSLARLWLENLPNACLVSVADAGHLVLQEKPETLCRISDFLSL